MSNPTENEINKANEGLDNAGSTAPVQGNQQTYQNPPMGDEQNPYLNSVSANTNAPAAKYSKKKLGIIIAVAAVLLVVIIVIVAVSSSSPKKTAKKYMEALIDGNAAAAQSCYAFDLEKYYADFYGEENLESMMDDDDSWASNYDDVSDIYDELEDEFDEYDGDIKSGEDIYQALLADQNHEIEEEEFEEYEIVSVKKVDVDDIDIDDFEEGYEDELIQDSDLDIKDYFNTKKIKSAAKVKVKYKCSEYKDSETLILVKIGGDWKIIDGYII